MVVIDATTLMHLLQPGVGVALRADKTPIDRPTERVAHLVKTLDAAKVKIIIPAPALSEVLVRVDAVEAQKLVEKIDSLTPFKIEPFDSRAAIEVAIMTRNSIDGGKKPAKRSPEVTWAKLKYDRQIVAIAIVNRASAIYSDDRDIRSIAKRANIPVIGLDDLDLPPEDPQPDLPYIDVEGGKNGK